MDGERGHRAVPHTADVILEAWAPDVTGCFEEAVAALVTTCAELAGDEDAPFARHPLVVPAGPRESQLLHLLDEVIFALDTADGVPVAAEIGERVDGGLDVVLRLAPFDRVVPSGSVPKAISQSDLEVFDGPEGVSCRFLVDV